MSDNNKNKALPDPAGEDFFIPNLCDSQHLLMLVVVAELLSILLVLAGQTVLLPFPWQRLLATSFLVLWIAMVISFLLCRLRPTLLQLPRATAAGVAYGIMLGVVAGFSVLADLLSHRLGLTSGIDANQMHSYQYILRNTLIGGIISGLVLRYFYLQEQLRTKQRAELTARVQALQSRIRPHFLFNSMNIIASLIHVDPDKAEQAVEDLSELFRASLKAVSEVSLNDELMLCQRYINIEELRLGDRLQVEWRLRELPDFVKIPLLTLQPLIENAIYHGVEPRLEPSLVRINVEYTGKEVVIILTNPVGQAIHARGNRMAIANVRQRLQAHYGDSAKLTTTANEELFTTYLSYPLSPTYRPQDKTDTIREQGVQA